MDAHVVILQFCLRCLVATPVSWPSPWLTGRAQASVVLKQLGQDAQEDVTYNPRATQVLLRYCVHVTHTGSFGYLPD